MALRDEEGQRTLLTDRVQSMVAEVGSALKGANKLPQHQGAALFNQHQDDLIEAAQAHAELLQWEAFTEALGKVGDPGTLRVLTWLRDLFGLSLIEKHLSWYLMNGRLSMQRGRTVGPTSTGCSSRSVPTPWTWSIPSATVRSTCGRPSPRGREGTPGRSPGLLPGAEGKRRGTRRGEEPPRLEGKKIQLASCRDRPVNICRIL